MISIHTYVYALYAFVRDSWYVTVQMSISIAHFMCEDIDRTIVTAVDDWRKVAGHDQSEMTLAATRPAEALPPASKSLSTLSLKEQSTIVKL